MPIRVRAGSALLERPIGGAVSGAGCVLTGLSCREMRRGGWCWCVVTNFPLRGTRVTWPSPAPLSNPHPAPTAGSVPAC